MSGFRVLLPQKPAIMQISLSNNVRKLRAERRLTQEDLADLVGVTRQTIAAIEANKHSTSLLVAFRIANALDTPIESAFAGK